MVKTLKAPKDANAPKRNLTAYFHFCADMRKKCAKEFSELAITEVTKRMSSKWGTLGEKDKKKYESAAAKDKTRYEKEKTKYEKTKNYKDHQVRLEEFKKQKKKADSKFRKDENRPKRAQSAWMIFLGEKRPGLIKKGFSITEVTSKGSEIWKTLGAAEKKKYEAKAAKLKTKYEKDIATYERSAKYKKYMTEKKAFEAEHSAKTAPKAKAQAKKKDGGKKSAKKKKR